MLKRVQIKNFRLCGDVEITELGPIAALVGRNGVGKSNTLQAIASAAMSAVSKGETFGPYDDSFGRGASCAVELEFIYRENHFVYRRSVGQPFQKTHSSIQIRESLSHYTDDKQFQLFDRVGTEVRLINRSPITIGEFVPAITAINSLFSGADLLVSTIRLAAEFLGAVRYYPLSDTEHSTPSPFILESDYKRWVAVGDATGSYEQLTLYKVLHLHQTNPKAFDALRSLMGRDGLDLIEGIIVSPFTVGARAEDFSLHIPEPGTDKNQYFNVLFVPRVSVKPSRRAVELHSLSAGTKRILSILTSLLLDYSAVMLIEQPEDGLHQGLTKELIDLLRANAGDTQLIMSSHSSALLNRLEPEEIRLVSLDQGLTAIRKLSANEVQLAQSYMNEHGPLYDFIDRVVTDD